MSATLNVPRIRAKRVNLVDGQKWCPRCLQRKPVDAFGFDRARDDGLSGWCRRCRAIGEKARRDADIEQTRATMRARYRMCPAKWLAHVTVARAVAAGRIAKPDACQSCGRYRPIEAHHHRGYERANWLDVVWRCRQCHKLEHTRIAAVA